MVEATILNILLFLPLAALVLLFAVPVHRAGAVKWVSLAAMLVQFVLGCILYGRFDAAATGIQFATDVSWIASFGVRYRIGLDGFNLLLVMLTVFLGPLAVLGSFASIRAQQKLFHAMIFILQFAMIGAFLAQDMFLFYLFWETMLIPMFLIIGVFGGERRIYATFKFVLYTALGSILMLAAVIYLIYASYKVTGRFSTTFDDLHGLKLPLESQLLLFSAFALSFAIKVPMVPLHTWLPDAHVEAPTVGSVILAGVLLKMGTYGFMKLGFPLFPGAAHAAAPALMVLAVIGILYGACLALVQTDIKKIIAYSSISHLGYVMLGLATFDLVAVQGAIVQMVSHGLTAAGLFLMVGMIYERCHTRELKEYGGLAKMMPLYSVFFMILTLASIGLPTTSGFTGEFMILFGSFTAAFRGYGQTSALLPLIASIAAVLGVVLGALYMLWFAERFLFGETRASHQPFSDLVLREKLTLGAIAIAIFWIGLYPQPLLQKTELAARQYCASVSADLIDSGGAP